MPRSQAGLYGNDDPRIALEAEFGDLTVWARAIMIANRSGSDYKTTMTGSPTCLVAVYDMKPHRFGFGVMYARDRFFGADTLEVGCDRTGLDGCTGQKVDSVWINASWSGRVGPIRGLLQGNVMLGTARGGTAGLAAGIAPGRDYDIFAGAVIAYVEADFGIVRPFVGFVFRLGGWGPERPPAARLSGLPHRGIDASDLEWVYGPSRYECDVRAAGLFVSGALGRGAE